MKIINPTNEALEVQIKGVKYRVEANASLSGVPTESALYWKDMLHGFISIVDEEKRVIEVEAMPSATFVREDMVEALGEEAVAKIEDEAEEVDVKVKKPSKGKK